MNYNKRTLLAAAAASVITLAASSAATIVNSNFEGGLTGWTVTGDWGIQPGGGSVGPTPWGWFSGGAADGVSYAECGLNGNESTGTLLSSIITADDQYLSFWHASNIEGHSIQIARIYDDNMTLLGSVAPIGGNDSVWREWTIDLGALGLQEGDQFYFAYEQVQGWAVIDNVSTSGPALPVPEPGSLALGALCAGAAFLRRRRGA